MSIQTVDLRVNERRPDIRLLPLVSGGAALILAVAAGIGLWASANGDVAHVVGVDPASPATTEAVTGGALYELGLPGVRLVDATSQAVLGMDPGPGACSDQEMYQRWRQAQAVASPEPVG
jgi:hypothetical protein